MATKFLGFCVCKLTDYFSSLSFSLSSTLTFSLFIVHRNTFSKIDYKYPCNQPPTKLLSCFALSRQARSHRGWCTWWFTPISCWIGRGAARGVVVGAGSDFFIYNEKQVQQQVLIWLVRVGMWKWLSEFFASVSVFAPNMDICIRIRL